MYCRAATEGKTLSVDGADHGAMQGARLMRHDRGYAPIMRPRAYPRISLLRAYPRDAGRERLGLMRGMRAGGASSGWARETISRLHDPSSARTCLKCARSFGRATMFQVRTTLRSCTTFPARIPLGLVFSAGIVSPRTWTECAWAAKRRVSESCVVKSRWLESDQSRQDQGCLPPSPTASKARRSAAGSRDRRVCRRLGIPRPQHCESRAFAVVSKA